jgi:hypothetical protein
MPAVDSGVQEQLEWEARFRPKAGLAAILAALLSLGGGIFSGLTFSDVPRASVLSALDHLAAPGPIGTQPSLRVPLYEWYQDNVGQFLGASAISALGALAIGAALTFLAFTVGARRKEFPRAGLYVPIVGSVLLAVALVLVAVGTDQTVDAVLAGKRTVDAVTEVKGGSLLTTGQLIEVAARFALGAGFILISLNALRAGLLTRFMGVLGIIAGVLLALPVFGGPLPVVQSFWLFAIGLLLVGRWPGGEPPAWAAGVAIPWPSSAELREARIREKDPEPEPRPERTTDRPSPATSARKKRKKRG